MQYMKRTFSGVCPSRWLAALALTLTLLTGCERDASGQLPGISGEAIHVEAERDAVEGFGIVKAGPGTRYGSLVLAVEFSQPLVGTQAFDELLRFEDDLGQQDSSWSLSDDGKTLRYPHVQAAKDYTLIISPELTAADGTRLGQEVRRSVYTGELEPAVGFASQGSVLPAKESRGLPVVAVNVAEVDVEFLRVREDKLPLFFSEYQRAGRRSAWSLDNDYDDSLVDMAESVYLNRFVLDGEKNQRSLSYLPIQDIRELQQPGLYFAVMKRSGRFQSSFDTVFFTVSDLGLHTRAYKERLFVHTASLASGAAAKRVELRILDAKGRTIHRGQTDANGNALLEYQLDAAHVLVAQSGNDVTLLPFNQPALDLSEFAVGGRGQAWFDVFAWSGRDLYRPGETVRVSALMRDHDGAPVEAQPVFVRLKQPDGKPFRETRLEPDAQGYFQFDQVIPEDAATGRWQLEFRTDPASKEAVQGMTLRIEEFLPERMKLDLSSAQTTLTPDEPLKLQADAAYLYGAPASGNRFTARLNVMVDQHPVESMPGWFFGDPTLSLPREPQEVIDTTFPADGTLTHEIALPEEAAKAGSPVTALVAGSVYETGGRSVTRTLKRTLWPAPALVALRPLFDDEDGAPANGRARFELRRVNAEGVAQAASGLQVTLVREHRDYVWTWLDERWDYDFTRRFENVETRSIDAGAESASFDFNVQWGEYRIDVLDPATGLTTRYPFRAGWSWNDDNRGLDARPDKIKLALDKTAYRSGDTLTVTVTPPHPGKGLLLVETDHLIYTQEIDAKPGSTFSIPVTDEWERHDVYITALVFRGGSAPSKITPARAVGVAHVPMERGQRTVEVNLTAPAQMRPEQAMKVAVNAPALAGKTAHVVVSAVDVGILNITRFPLPDAAAHFFGKRRLATDAWDIYGRVIESFEGSRAKLKFGGDMALVALPQARRPTAKVQTVDLYSGPVALDANGKASIELMVPDFNGTLRVSALVYAGGLYGKGEAETLVRAPVVAEASFPRVLAPGDSSTLTLDVQNFSGNAGKFRVRVEGEGPLNVGNGSRRIQLAADAKTTLNFPLTAREGHTVAKVRIRVDGNGVQLDRRYDLPVRAAWPQILRSQTRTLDPLAPFPLGRELLDGLMPDSVNVRLMVSPVPPIPFASALDGALRYPYGCAEQTTSKGYAALILDEATTALLGMGQQLSPEQRRARMEGALARLSAMQVASGHFSMWGGEYDVNPALTPYITEFLIDAREAGFNVPENVLQKALDRVSADLLAGDPEFYGHDHRKALKFSHQAYSGYVLARLNRAPLGTLRTLYDNERANAINGLPLVHLGLALHMQGDTRRGEAAIKAGFEAEDQRPGWLGDYGSPLRDAARMVALVHERGVAKPEHAARAIAIGRDIDARVRASSGRLWLSTQEQIALARLGKALVQGSERKVEGAFNIGIVRHAIPASAVYARLFDAADIQRGVRFELTGTPPLYISVDTAGIPRQPPAPDSRVLKIERDWFNVDGSPWVPGPLKEGQALIARLKVTAQQDMPDALITDLLPAGLEIENFNLTDPKQWDGIAIDGIELAHRSYHHTAGNLRHEEFRDDRYVAAVGLRKGRTTPLFYLVRAVTPGTYHAPPPLAEDMYRPELRGVGRVSPATVTVVEP